MKMFKYSLDNKMYHTLNYELTKTFNTRVFKVSLNGNFSCPNFKNGSGCIFCSAKGSGDFAGDKNKSITEQFTEVKEKLNNKWPDTKYIAYFQANTNTYAPVSVLKKKYEEALKIPNVVGLNIGTRPDAITDECLDYLKELNKRTYLTIELGLQSMHNKTLKLINRGHDLKCFDTCIKRLKENNIKVVVHIINGLPYETYDMMMDTVRHLNKLKIDGIKIHMLHILKDTVLEKMYNKEKFHVLTRSEYIDIVCDQIENLDEDIVIHRITGDPIKEDLIKPSWLIKKFTVLNDIDKELKRRNTYQGFNLSILNRTRSLMGENLKENDLVIDATIGNGKDSLFLINIVRNGYLFGFDIQNDAIDNTNNLLKDKFNNYTLFNTGHENMYELLKEYSNKISLIVFNLGYLPKGNPCITTKSSTTINAIENGLKLLNKKGHIVITIYPGHPEGLKESTDIKKYLDNNTNYAYTEYHNTDNETAPYVINIKKKS